MPEIAPPDTSALLVYGPLGAIAAVVLYFVIRYGPTLVEAHLGFMETAKNTQQQLATNLETLTENHEVSAKHHAKTHRAIGRLVDAAKESTTCPDVQRHLDRAHDELRMP